MRLRGELTREQRNRDYDSHQPGARFSSNRNERLYGRCGCQSCRLYREDYIDAGMLSPVDERETKMGSINTCDRCPSMVSGNALGMAQIRTSSDPDNTEVVKRELCPACIEEILSVVEIEVKERSQRAFRKPYTRVNEEDPVSAMTAEQLSAALLEKLMKDANRQLESGH